MNPLTPPPPWNCRLLGGILALLVSPAAPAEISLRVGVLTLQPDQAHQTVMLFATNSGPSPVAVGGFDLALTVAPGVTDTPRLSLVDLVSGSLFESYAPTQTADPANTARRQAWFLTLPALGLYPEIPARTAVPLARLEFDTTDLDPGDFVLAVTGTGLGDTMLYDSFGLPLTDFTAHDGSLRLGPIEPPPVAMPDSCPGSAGLLLLGATALTLWRSARPLAQPRRI